jgi:hypothetical protein
VAQVNGEATASSHRPDDGCCFVGKDLPAASARCAVEVAVSRDGLDVVLLAPVGAVAVAYQPKAFEDVHRPVDGGRDRRRIHLPATIHELRPGYVTIGP